MTLRTKLLGSYATTFVIVLGMIFLAHGTARRSRRTAEEISRTYEQGVLAERLRWAIQEYSERAIEMSPAEPGSRDAASLEHMIARFIDSLRAQARMSRDSVLELDHINGFSEAYREMRLLRAEMGRSGNAEADAAKDSRLHERLDEIRDEVDDAAVAMQQYFRSSNRESIAHADELRRVAVAMTGLAGVLVAFQFVVMVILLRRWVTQPMRELARTADRIGAGDLSARVKERPEREWEKVAEALHAMARSLEMMQNRLRTNERFAAIGEVAAYTAHNIRNPLASIRMMAQVALPESNEATSATLKDIIGCVDTMEIWIAGLLNFAKPLAVNLSLNRFDGIAASVAETARIQAAPRHVTVSYQLGCGDTRISADEALIEQALYAIVSNAVEASSDGGTVEVSTHLEGEGDRRTATIVIADRGAGISDGMKTEIFKPFVTSKKHGTGLGLAQAKKILDLHLAQIELESELGRGTRITVHCPIAEDANGTDSHN